jgi:hypothetical protein
MGGAGRSVCFFGVTGATKVLVSATDEEMATVISKATIRQIFMGVAAGWELFELRQPAIEKQVFAPGSIIESINRKMIHHSCRAAPPGAQSQRDGLSGKGQAGARRGDS